MVYIAEDVARLPRSGIRELMGMALTIPDAIHLEIGEPHFPTPSFVLDGLKEFYSKGDIKYTPTVGIHSLRDKIAKKLLKEKNWKVPVLLGSALNKIGLKDVFEKISDFINLKKNGNK